MVQRQQQAPVVAACQALTAWSSLPGSQAATLLPLVVVVVAMVVATQACRATAALVALQAARMAATVVVVVVAAATWAMHRWAGVHPGSAALHQCAPALCADMMLCLT